MYFITPSVMYSFRHQLHHIAVNLHLHQFRIFLHRQIRILYYRI